MNGESYVVRIYKRSTAAAKARNAANLDGIVENTLSGERTSFHDKEELWAILARPPRLPKASSRKSVAPSGNSANCK